MSLRTIISYDAPFDQGLRVNAVVISVGSKPPQRSNAARVRNMNRFNGGKLPGNSKHFFKTSKDKAVPGKRSFKR